MRHNHRLFWTLAYKKNPHPFPRSKGQWNLLKGEQITNAKTWFPKERTAKKWVFLCQQSFTLPKVYLVWRSSVLFLSLIGNYSVFLRSFPFLLSSDLWSGILLFLSFHFFLFFLFISSFSYFSFLPLHFFLLFNLILPSKWLLFFKLSISILFKWTGLIINVNTYNCLLFSLNNSYYFKSAYFMFFSFSFSIYYVVLFFLAFKIIFSKLNELVLFTLWFLYNLIS